MKLRRPDGLTLLAGALLLLMPLLAVLQFRWVGQVSDAEQARMRRNVEIAADQFSEAFNSEIRRATIDLRVWASTVRERSWDRFADSYDTWANQSGRPALVQAVYLVIAEGGQPVALKWDTEGRAFRRIDWPQALEPWRADFIADLADFNAGIQPNRQERFRRQDALIVSPLRGSGPRNQPLDPDTGSRRLTTEVAFGFTVIELNVPYIRDVFLPELLDRHFKHGEDSYRVAVIDTDHPENVIFRSDRDAPVAPGESDVVAGIFQRNPGGPPRGAGPRAPISDLAVVSDLTATPGNDLRAMLEDLPGRWALLVQHRSGSLGAAVAAIRFRNLAISFGVLILLSISIGLLALTSRKAQRLAEQQIEFVAGVSHELRTPVAVIRSAAENLSQGVVGNTERVKRYGQMIESEARRLGEMVERVLQYAGIESGLGYGARVPLSPAEIVESAVDSAIPLLGPDKVIVERHIPDDLPPVVGDAAALRSAVQNLVANAVKYGGPDRWVGITVEHVRDGRRPEVRITVSDHGPGISAAELPHIFEPFYRGGDAVARQIHGNGLGLSLVKRIVAAHGGRVAVDSRAGAGSSFIITLPAATPDTAATSVAGEIRAAAHS